MKKIVLIIAMCVIQTVMVDAQVPYPPSTDTLPCGVRQRNYYYSSWFDTCYWYFVPEAFNKFPDDGERVATRDERNGNPAHTFDIFQQFATRTIRVKGIWAMVSQEKNVDIGNLVLDSTRLPEYIYLYRRDTNELLDSSDNFLVRVASTRWDTAQPKMMCMKQTADERLPKYYCHIYEAMFDTVYTLSGEYWLGGTANSNTRHDSLIYDSVMGLGVWTRVHDHWPTHYVIFHPQVPYGWMWGDPYDLYGYSFGADGPFSLFEHGGLYGPYGLILDEQQYYVELAAADSAQGFVRSTAYYPAGSYQTITATARSCYRFSHWNDGDTTNPRTIQVMQDTAFTAYFEVAPTYDIAVRSNDTTMGRAELQRWYGIHIYPVEPHAGNDETHLYLVVGSDTTYCGGDTIRLRATAYPGYYFWKWDDEVMENPRCLTVTQDTLVTAIFSKEEPPPYDPPCPRVYRIVPVVEDIGRVRLVWPWSATRCPPSVRNLQSGWELALGLAGTPPDSCQIISCDSPEKLLSDLEIGVRYVAYVRTLCKHNSEYYSDWSDSVEIYFPLNRYTVTVTANYEERGHVYGGGEYGEGEVATLTASAERHYSFLQWNDGVADNSRLVEVTQDTAFTALFSEWEGIEAADGVGEQFRLVPNPATEEVRCLTAGDEFDGGVLRVVDAAGREVLRRELPRQTQGYTFRVADYPSGTYFVTLTTAKGTSTQKLVVEGK